MQLGFPRVGVQRATPARFAGVPWSALRAIGEELDDGAAGERRWYVAHTKPQQEFALSRTMEAMGLPYLLPLLPRSKRYGHRHRETMRPLFSGYVFVWGNPELRYDLDQTRRVAQVIEVFDQPQLQGELESLHRLLTSEETIDPYRGLKRGVRVEVTRGPFEGVCGVVERRDWDRLFVQIEFLGRGISLEIDGSLLRPL